MEEKPALPPRQRKSASTKLKEPISNTSNKSNESDTSLATSVDSLSLTELENSVLSAGPSLTRTSTGGPSLLSQCPVSPLSENDGNGITNSRDSSGPFHEQDQKSSLGLHELEDYTPDQPPELPPPRSGSGRARTRRTSEKSKQSESLSSSAEPLSMESLRAFARKWEYTDEEFDKATKNLAHSVTTDVLLAELVSQRAKNDLSQMPPKPSTSFRRQQSSNEGSNLRSIVIDGSNVAITHGQGEIFSWRGIRLAVDWFRARGHTKITVFVPAHRLEKITSSEEKKLIQYLKAEKILIQTPTRQLDSGRNVTCYDDRFILQLASEEGSVVISNDKYRDLVNESPAFRETIIQRLLCYTFAGNRFMPADDPLGKRGITLDQLLRVDASRSSYSDICPYGRKCTYGTKCKFTHPNRFPSALPDEATQRALLYKKRLEQHLQAHSQTSAYSQRSSNGAYSSPQPYSLPSQFNSPSLHYNSSPPMVVSRAIGAQKVDQAPPLPQRPGRGAGTSLPLMNQAPSLPQSSYAQSQRSVSGEDFMEKGTPRGNIYFHLCNLFPERKVYEAMKRLPDETDPNRICQPTFCYTSITWSELFQHYLLPLCGTASRIDSVTGSTVGSEQINWVFVTHLGLAIAVPPLENWEQLCMQDHLMFTSFHDAEVHNLISSHTA